MTKYINTLVIASLGLACVAAALFHLATLANNPPIFIDEAWYANTAWHWLTSGENTDTLHAGTPVELRFPFIGDLPYVISFASLGLGLFQARLVSWIFGVILLVLTLMAARQSYGPIAGGLAALLLALSAPFTQASHYARPDIFLAVTGMLSFILVQHAFAKERRWAHFLAGLIIALSVDIHQNAILYAMGLSVLYLLTYRQNVFRQAGTWLFIAGGAVGVAYYLAVYIIPSLKDTLNYYQFSFVNSHPIPIASLNPIDLIKSARDEIGRYHFFDNSLDFVLIGASIIYFAIRRHRADLALLLFVGTVFAGFILLIGNKHDIYAILLYPFLMIMVAESIVSIIRSTRDKVPVYAFSIALLALVIFTNAYQQTRSALESRDYNYEAITNKIKSVVPQGSRIVGLPHWWIGLSEHDYRSILGLSFYNIVNGYSLTEGLQVMQPDILIVDTGLRGLLVDEGYFTAGSGFELYKMPRKEFEDFLSRRGEQILDFRDMWHGRFEIYSIDWDK